jgi:hypothetical protein
VQGPGAGPDVTAAGVFGDLLMIAQSLGAHSASPSRLAPSHRAIEPEGVPA